MREGRSMRIYAAILCVFLGWPAQAPAQTDAAAQGALCDQAAASPIDPRKPSGISGVDIDKIDRPRGMDITVVTTATNNDEGRALLKHLGFPFKEN